MNPPAPVTRIRVLLPMLLTAPKSFVFCCKLEDLLRTSLLHCCHSRNLPGSWFHRRVYGSRLALHPHKLGVPQNREIKERAMPAQFIVKEGVHRKHSE